MSMTDGRPQWSERSKKMVCNVIIGVGIGMAVILALVVLAFSVGCRADAMMRMFGRDTIAENAGDGNTLSMTDPNIIYAGAVVLIFFVAMVVFNSLMRYKNHKLHAAEDGRRCKEHANNGHK